MSSRITGASAADRGPGSRPPAGSGGKRLRNLALFIGALLFLFEEWLWTCFTRFFAWLDRRPAVRWIEDRLMTTRPMVALVVLCVPIMLLFPFKIVGLWMIASGRFFMGCAIMLAAKILGTAIVARIFVTCRPQLLTMQWFARMYGWTLVLSRRVHVWIDQQPAWHATRRAIHRAVLRSRAHLRAWTRGRRAASAEDGASMRKGALMRWRKRRKAQRRRAAAAATAAAATRESETP